MKRLLRILGISVAIAALSSEPVLSGEVFVPLPGLNGLYDFFTPTRTDTFEVSLGPKVIERAKLRIVGTLPVPSFTNCGYNGALFSAGIPATAGSWVVQEFYMDLRIFDITANFRSLDDPTWDFLLDRGKGTISLTAVSRPLPNGCRFEHGSWETEPNISYVEIIFVLGDPVPVEQNTWGAIKALYR